MNLHAHNLVLTPLCQKKNGRKIDGSFIKSLHLILPVLYQVSILAVHESVNLKSNLIPAKTVFV